MLFYRDGCQGVPPFAATNPFLLLRTYVFFCKSAFVLKAEPREEWGKRSSLDPRGLTSPRGFHRKAFPHSR